MESWPSVWLLLTPIALWVLIKQPSRRKTLLFGAITTLPVLGFLPILSPTYFSAVSVSQIVQLFASQALIIFSAGIIASSIYESILRPRTIRSPKASRHFYLTFLIGLTLTVTLFDIFTVPLITSLLFGLGINLLVAVRYFPEELYDILFASVLMGLFYVFVYVALLADLPGESGQFWLTPKLLGLNIFGVPWEKLVTVFVYGLFWGPLYVGLKDVSNRKN